MKSLIELYLVVSILSCPAGAQDPSKPVLRRGISVQMPIASHAAEMREADEIDATVVAITADGKLFAGVEPTDPGALGSLRAETIYVKADSRVPFQTILTVLDALRGKSVVLLSASPASGDRTKIAPPYGIKLIVSR